MRSIKKPDMILGLGFYYRLGRKLGNYSSPKKINVLQQFGAKCFDRKMEYLRFSTSF